MRVVLVIALAACAPAANIAEGLDVRVLPPPVDAGVLAGGGCTSPSGKLLIFLDSPTGPVFCTTLLFRRGVQSTVFPDVVGPEGYGLLDARSAPSCEALEAGDGTLRHDTSLPVDDVWGTFTKELEINGVLWGYRVRDASLRSGTHLWTLLPGAWSVYSRCRYP